MTSSCWGSGRRGLREATTEEEEEKQEAEQRARSQRNSLETEAKNRTILKLANSKACDWTDQEWGRLQKGYASSEVGSGVRRRLVETRCARYWVITTMSGNESDGVFRFDPGTMPSPA